ncbi:MAG: hypothetical protein ACFFD2_15705 [Promethearchaeota archaeon]
MLKNIRTSGTTVGTTGSDTSGDRKNPSVNGRVKEGRSQLPLGSDSSTYSIHKFGQT